MGYEIALNIPDCHIPWQDQKAYELMLAVAVDVDSRSGLNEINILGDYLDFYWCNLHPKLPECMSISETAKMEIHEGRKKLGELRRLFPESRINFIEGNHEYRLVRYLVSKCGELFDFFSLPDLLHFEKHNINYIPFGKKQLHSCLGTDYYLRHVPFNQGKHCAATTLQNKHISLGFGHTHRKQSFTGTDALGNEMACYSLGWLGDRNAPVFSYMDSDNWGQGFQFTLKFKDGTWVNHYVDIKNNKAYYEGVLYEI